MGTVHAWQATKGEGEWGVRKAPIPLPLSLPPYPLPLSTPATKAKGAHKHENIPSPPFPYLFFRDALLVLSESLKEMFSLSLCNQTCSFHYCQPLL